MSTRLSHDDLKLLKGLFVFEEAKRYALALSSKWVTCPHCGFETPVPYPYLVCDCSVCREIFEVKNGLP